MSAEAVPLRRNLGRIYALQAKTEFLKVWRLPMYAIPTLAFPLMFYLLFAVALNRGAGAPTYLLATYGAFGVMNAALFGFGVGIAVERGQGWTLFQRATPMPPLAHLFGKLVMAMIFGALIVLILSAAAIWLGGVRMPAGTWLSLAGVLVSGAVPFAAFGLALGCWVGPNSAPAVVNLISMPVSLASGLWFPIHVLPAAIRKIAPFLPPYHYGQLALGRLGLGEGVPALFSVAVLAAFTALSLLLAWAGYRRDEGKTFG